MPQHFLAPEYLRKLSQEGDTYAQLRRTVANAFRNPQYQDAGYEQQLLAMVNHFDRQGIVEVRKGIPNDPELPPLMQVEDRGGQPLSEAERKATDSRMRQVARRGTPKPAE
ncbi:hypothetical protein [Duganella radicis]|uniref:hypothetical protein n=1 Tax=Duganella radicis TaxID=551988 RepID=UPI001E64A405|nr:hypothetical protein [Duganella radicis]